MMKISVPEKPWFRFLFVWSLLLTLGCGIFSSDGFGQTASPPALSRDEQWRQDVQFLAKELPARHKNLFFHLKKADFNRSIQQLDKTLPKLSDDEIKVELMRIVASVNDAHTDFNPQFKKVLPLAHLWFKDGLYLLRSPAEHQALLGCKLIRIGNTPIDQAFKLVKPLISYENDQWLLTESPQYLMNPGILKVLKIIPDDIRASLTYQDRQGQTHTVEINSVEKLDGISWVQALDPEKRGAPLYRQKQQLNYWFEYLAESKTLFVKYNRCRDMDDLPFAKFNQDLWAFADQHQVDRLVIDLRHNGGGNSVIFRPMLEEIKKRTAINQPGRLFAIIGRGTFSSGYLNALELRQQTKATIFGEPTGQKPNAFGEVKSFKLPNSGLEVSYSTKYFKTSDKDEPSMLPDVDVRTSIDDFLNARDPILAAILAK
ncbi:MAG: peptidase S41 [Acidobacteria bacterium]|nr:peptidase S41 [Acidobacteriota bacterium]